VTAPIVALFTGPPGTGKSTLADTIGREIHAPVFAWDWVMAPLRQVPSVHQAVMALPHRDRWAVGYALLDQLVEKQLRNGQHALIDCVARAGAEARFAATANRHAASFFVVECSCDDPDLHRTRVEGRVRAIPGWYELEWAEVQVSRESYEPLRCAKVVVDAGAPLGANLDRVRRHLGIGEDGDAKTGRDG
jgi:predicted kinase